MKKWFFIKRVKVLNSFTYSTSDVFFCEEKEVLKNAKELPTPNDSGHRGNVVVYELTPEGEEKRREDLEELAKVADYEIITGQTIEKEAKSLITKEGFEKLIKLFLFTPASFKEQINKYFLDAAGVIKYEKPTGTTLRLRQKKDTYELQFKLPMENGENKEYEDIFYTENGKDKYDSLFEDGIIFDGNVRQGLMENGIDPNAVDYIGDVTTLRYTVMKPVLKSLNPSWEKAEVCLDETSYPGGSVDYEIEIESDDLIYSKQVLAEILQQAELPIQSGPRKIERFYSAIGL